MDESDQGPLCGAQAAAAWRLESQRRFAEDKCRKAELNNEYCWPRLFKGIRCSQKKTGYVW